MSSCFVKNERPSLDLNFTHKIYRKDGISLVSRKASAKIRKNSRPVKWVGA